ncbi:hypothetical protein ABID58_004655 [Bradyrhizobium sp. S3.2.6]|uniref:hypothetical protein n=1 Tax=Bradyrhizobium sp. S3.2.6 TaxID=3156428 RepID=UPI003394C356
MKRGIFLISLVALAWWLIYPAVMIRYRLVAEMEWNGQPRVGSGVIQVVCSRNIPFLGSRGGTNSAVEGEAVSIDIGPGDSLFMLLKDGPLSVRSGPEDIIPNLFGVVKGGFGPEHFPRINAIEGRREVPLEQLPLIVRLRNTNDPKSAILFVPPGGQPPNQDLVLKRAEIEIVSSGIWPLNQFGITGTPITHGVKQKLPWLEGFTGYTGGQFDPIWSHPEKNLTGNDFMKG